MAYNQYSFRYTTGRASNLAALIFTQDRSKLRTSGTILSNVSSVADASYAAGRLSATERVTAGPTGTGQYYLATFPALAVGFYSIEIYDVPTPSPSSPSPSDSPLSSDGGTLVYWDGTDLWEGLMAVKVAEAALEAGGDAVTLSIEEDGSGDPLQGVSVWLTSDALGVNVVAGTRITDAAGELDRLLTAGTTYYLWARLDGYEPIMGESFVANIAGHTFEMAESAAPPDTSIGVDYFRLRQEIARHLGWSTNAGLWDSQQAIDMEDIIDAGYRYFLWHPAEEPHVWSFLRPTTTLSVLSGDYDYNLPADFGWILQDGFTYSLNSKKSRVEKMLEGDLRALRATAAANGPPKYYALRAKSPVEGEQQGYEVLFYPTPDADFTLSYRYAIVPQKLSSANPYPLGGMMHGETLLQSCLAVADKKLHDEAGIQAQRYAQCLSISIRIDKEMA